MKIVDKFLNKHHFFNKPHKWFLAFLSSPIHFAEKHYEKKYKMNFGHARKLFIFDMSLLASIIALIGLTIFWFTYDPTVVENISVKITPQTHSQAQQTDRIKSGEHIEYLIEYQNNSDSILKEPKLILNLPEHFQVTSATPKEDFTNKTKTFSLPDLNKKASGAIKIEGYYYGTPGEHDRITAHLSYKQKHRDAREEKIASIITILQDSYVNAEIKTSDKILAGEQTPIKINLGNSGHHDINNITLPLSSQNFSIENVNISEGIVEDNNWRISNLKANQTITASGTMQLKDYSDNTQIKLQPEIKIRNKKIAQEAATHQYKVVQPQINFTTNWEDDSSIKPGSSKKLSISIKNEGNEPLKNMSISIPIDKNIIDVSKLTKLNTGVIKNEDFVISSDYNAALTSLKPNEQKQISVNIPVNSFIASGENLNLKVNPNLSADLSSLPGNKFNTKANSKYVRISTDVNLDVSARYYTREGDQLGRGPLPPRVGENTKYWVFVNLRNTTNNIEDLSFTATMPQYIKWTGKSSVSHGRGLKYNSNNRTITWRHNQLGAHEKGGIYMQLAITPNDNQRGKTPILLRNIKFSTTDSYTGSSISKTTNPIDISLPTDSRAQNRGVVVQ